MKRVKKLALTGIAVFGVFTLIVMVLGTVMTVQVAQSPKDTATVQREEVTPDGLFLAINRVRSDNKLQPYSRNSLLDKSAGLKCRDMMVNNYYSHKNPSTGKSGGSYAEDVGQKYKLVSENLNQGDFDNSAHVVSSWMGSESHAASILDPEFTEVGFAVCLVDGLTTVVQHKIEPAPPAQPTTTRCTYYDYGAYGGYGSPTTTCKTY